MKRLQLTIFIFLSYPLISNAITHSYNFKITDNNPLLTHKSKSKISFCLPKKEYKSAFLAGNFTNWKKNMIRMNISGEHLCAKVKLNPNKTYIYKFLTDKGWVYDRHNPDLQDDGYSSFNSVIRLNDKGGIVPPFNNSIFKRKSESSRIILHTRINDFPNEKSVEEILEKLEIIYDYVQETTKGYSDKNPQKLKIFFRKQKNQSTAGVFLQNEIHLTGLKFNYSNAQHEITHFLLKGLHNSTLIKEGIATLISLKTPTHISNYHFEKSKMIKSILSAVKYGYYTPIKELYSMNSFIELSNPQIAYYESAFFIQFLFETFGNEKTWLFLFTGDTTIFFPLESFQKLDDEFKKYLISLQP